MRKKIFLFFNLVAGIFFYHQYYWAGPYDAFIRQEPIPPEKILEGLKQWRYHSEVWFEIVPDALTTVFKRLGMGGWSESGHRVCVEGCSYWTEYWTDGFHSTDLQLEKISIDGSPDQSFQEPRYFDVETWGRIRTELEKKGQIPQAGERVRICGPLRVDRPYYVFTLHPDRSEDYRNLGSCEAIPKDSPSALELASKKECGEISSMTLFDQIGLLDSLADAKQSDSLVALIEKTVSCVRPEVIRALSTNEDVQEDLLERVPSIQAKLQPLKKDGQGREGNPVRNTIADLLKNWFHIEVSPEGL
jgi:hypothetical protein